MGEYIHAHLAKIVPYRIIQSIAPVINKRIPRASRANPTIATGIPHRFSYTVRSTLGIALVITAIGIIKTGHVENIRLRAKGHSYIVDITYFLTILMGEYIRGHFTKGRPSAPAEVIGYTIRIKPIIGQLTKGHPSIPAEVIGYTIRIKPIRGHFAKGRS